MSKIDFPIGVELKLRGGGVAVLYEFVNDRWYGRMNTEYASYWEATHWNDDGSYERADRNSTFDILPPKRKAWVVWYPDTEDCRHMFRKPCEIVCSESYAAMRAKELGGTYREIEEP